MNKTLSVTMVIAVAGLAVGLSAPAFASPEVAQKAEAEVSAAQSDLNQGRNDAAIERTERAETALLNAKQAGDETAPKAMDALKDARDQIMKKDKTAAKASLTAAMKDLKS